MNCQVKDELVSQLVALNNKLNLLSPDLVHGDEERAEVQQQRENLYAEIKHHRAKGHDGKPCPAANQVWATVVSDWFAKRESGQNSTPKRFHSPSFPQFHGL
jgi:hypothetical protein